MFFLEIVFPLFNVLTPFVSPLNVLARHTINPCHAYDTNMTSVCLSVTLVDCDHIVQQKVEMGTRQDKSSVFWLPARKSRPGRIAVSCNPDF